MRSLGITGLSVFPISLGTNVFGWTADKETSFAVLDAYVEGGGNFLDTADVYPYWATGESTSETIIGEWLAARRNRDSIVLATKVGMLEGHKGLAPATIRTAVEDSLRRLRTDYIDLYWAHVDDRDTPLVETLSTFDTLIREGKVRYVGASNYDAPRLAEALKTSDEEGLARYVALQQPYNLVERAYEGDLRAVVAAEGLASTPYSGLARGFLTGKYTPGANVDSPRAGAAARYLETEHGPRTLQALTRVAQERGAAPASVALAWLAAQPTITTPLASARNVEQLRPLMEAAALTLSEEELTLLDEASRP
ncbi:aryl-alcohol dehydrogenase-like predicted oxidoreductase [Nonomuraea fuscirosea]|uniref:Aryl-alcohol dehydrogenase-like predicted oxidoreductase n=1 Tax=Nonomuraea fuscirosea TaxID=1291556 RepID=A0A2T0NC24_9ACTN|nr:aldo/keto reductase [Nonomuraea fuscirosea]PRX70490.1 aryl-alcohol dehydrogenase-like predicted oxidoreductase [Nonomuraea fuscirosea]